MAFTSFLGVYLVLAFFDPGLLSYDMRQKFRALADETITITATVLAAPVQPVVTATADCNETTGVLSVALDWADDTNSYTYDIDRESAALVTGLVASAYTDTNVVVNTTYQYEVTANGPMAPGFATSVPVSVTTPATCEVTAAAPAVTIVSFAGRGVDSYQGRPRVSNRRPLFSGTTSMPNATILVVIGQSFIAEVSANANGYWEWKPPYGVTSGSHVFTVTATDPNDSARFAMATLRFDILKDESSGNQSGKKGKGTNESVLPEEELPVEAPLSFSLAVANDQMRVFQGGSLFVRLVLEELVGRYTDIVVPVRFSVLTEDRGVVFSKTEKIFIKEGGVIEEDVPIPMYIAPGTYVIQVEVLFDALSISRTASFTVMETPLISLSSGQSISYSDIIRNLGWIVFAALVSAFSWVSLLIREFLLMLRGNGAVMARELLKAGFIRR